jgi:hypothetical protein
MIKIDIHKIENQPNNRHLFETIIPWKKIKINNAVHFLTNTILNDKIKKKKKQLKDQRKKKHIISVGKLVKPINRVSQARTPNL